MRNCFLICILLLLALPVNIAASDFYITTSDLNIRSGPSTNFKALKVLQKGDTVLLLESTNEYWVKIQYQDKVGYVSQQYLNRIEESELSSDNDSWTIIIILILILVFIGSISLLKYSGKKNRSKSFASFLALLFGIVGFQYYYLGEYKKGNYSFFFCWTLIPFIIGLIDFIKLSSMSYEDFNDKYILGISYRRTSTLHTKKDVRIESSKNDISGNSQNIAQIDIVVNKDESIIDVNKEKLDLSIEKPEQREESELDPPYWEHTYVYSYDEINYASRVQKKYYLYFKNKVLKGEFVDIKGFTNYAFILYFDFLNEYQNHRDIKLLEEQFKLIGEICPKTKNYTLGLLQNELRIRSDSYSIDKLKNLEEPIYQFEHGYSDYDPDAYKLGKLYQEKLGLNKNEVTLLNKFWNPSNVFTSIEGCCIAIIMQYLFILKELSEELKVNEKSFEDEISYFKNKLDKIYSKRYSSEWGYYDKNYFKQKAESDIYLIFFKRIENSVRESFGHKRKISDNLPFNDNSLNKEFEERLGNLFNDLNNKFKNNIGNPDIKTQIELNAQNVNRWKIEFNEFKESFLKDEIRKFIDGILNLEETNQKNPNIENIFFEASKFIANHDKIQSLKYYAQYIYYDLKSKKFDNKELTTTVQKSLFKTEEQINNFKNIITELIETSDIKKALDDISKIYIPKRKKIKLDKSEIQEVEQKHDGTVELLNEYLETEKDEFSEEETFKNEEIEINVISSESNSSFLISDIRIGKVQEELLKRIVANSFQINQTEVDKFATENGMFKNQLIDSINEACEELLDGEALIEEDEDKYIIEESYYKEIAL